MAKKSKITLVTDEPVAGSEAPERVTITPPNIAEVKVRIRFTAPYVSNKFSQRARDNMIEAQKQGSQARNKSRKKPPKDFDAQYRGAMHISTEGWHGLPASSIRAALISACRMVGFAMTVAKQAVFCEADGYDAEDGQALVRIYGEPRPFDYPVRIGKGSTDIIRRPRYAAGSYCDLTLSFDRDNFSASDVINLLCRAGIQVGVGAGRPDSKTTSGMGWGRFAVDEAGFAAGTDDDEEDAARAIA